MGMCASKAHDKEDDDEKDFDNRHLWSWDVNKEDIVLEEVNKAYGNPQWKKIAKLLNKRFAPQHIEWDQVKRHYEVWNPPSAPPSELRATETEASLDGAAIDAVLKELSSPGVFSDQEKNNKKKRRGSLDSNMPTMGDVSVNSAMSPPNSEVRKKPSRESKRRGSVDLNRPTQTTTLVGLNQSIVPKAVHCSVKGCGTNSMLIPYSAENAVGNDL